MKLHSGFLHFRIILSMAFCSSVFFFYFHVLKIIGYSKLPGRTNRPTRAPLLVYTQNRNTPAILCRNWDFVKLKTTRHYSVWHRHHHYMETSHRTAAHMKSRISQLGWRPGLNPHIHNYDRLDLVLGIILYICVWIVSFTFSSRARASCPYGWSPSLHSHCSVV